MEQLMPLIPYVVFAVIGGLIGWITNYVAIKMLFRPRTPIRLPFFTMQGLVPKRQLELAASIGEAVHNKLVKHEDIVSILDSPKLKERILTSIEQQVDQFMGEIVAKNPMVGMFLSGDFGTQVRETLSAKLEGAIPKMLGEASGVLEEELDFRAIVEDRVAKFDLSTLEEMIQSISKKELRAIEILGGVLGAAIGIFQAALMPFLQFG